MTIKHDADGFLIGDPIDLQRAVSLLGSIQSDVRAMRQALAEASGGSPYVSTPVDRAPAIPGRSSASAAKAEMPAAVPNGRDATSRFFASGADSDSPNSSSRAGNQSLSGGFAQRVASAVTEGISNSEETDPSVKAFKEVAEPLKRGYKTIFGDRDEKSQSSWFRRLWGELKGIRNEQTIYEKATIKSLKAIEDKPAAGEDGGVSWTSALITAVTRLGPLLIPMATALAAAAAGIAILVKFFTGNSSADKDIADGIQKGLADPAKQALKKIGIDKDAEIESIREKNRREQNGTDEYERMDRARAAVAAAGVEQASPEYNDSLSRAYQELERQDADSKKSRFSRWMSGLKGSKTKDRALRTGAAYSQGNIDGLDDAHTRALIASTAETESAGGELGISNKEGYMGRYQAGAGWLADAGLIKGGSAAVKAAIKAGGYKSEWQWAKAGGMSKFLNNPENWVNGMNKEKYLSSADIQDGAFKVNSDRAYAELMKLGAIKPGDSQEKIAGLLKARHIAGIGGALAVSKGGTGKADANGTTPLKYYEQMAKDASGYIKTYSAVSKMPQIATIPLPTMPAMPAPPQIPDAPPIQVPLSSDDTGRNITVTPPANEPGQDLSNRRIAHVVTGGYSSGS